MFILKLVYVIDVPGLCLQLGSVVWLKPIQKLGISPLTSGVYSSIFIKSLWSQVRMWIFSLIWREMIFQTLSYSFQEEVWGGCDVCEDVSSGNQCMLTLNLSFIYVHCEMIICPLHVHVVLYEYLCTIWIEVFQFVEFFINIWLTVCMLNLLDLLLSLSDTDELTIQTLVILLCRQCTCISVINLYQMLMYWPFKDFVLRF